MHAHVRIHGVRRFALLAALPAALLSPACDSAEPETEQEDYSMCQYKDFSVDITNGPSKGLHLAGTIYFVQQDPDTRIGGLLQTPDGLVVPLSATLNEHNDLALTFRTDAGHVMGLGHMTGELCHADNIEGTAMGPVIADSSDIAESDSGHWLLSSPKVLTQSPEGPFVYPGDITDPDGGGYTTNVTTSQCTGGGGVIELRCGFLCLYTYEACRGGDHNDEVIINGTASPSAN